MTEKIFISYRTLDALAVAANLHRDLADRFGVDCVFRDADGTKGGAHWQSTLQQKAQDCLVMLVLIGPRWSEPSGEDEASAAGPGYWVSREIALALSHQRLIIPVLLDGTRMPSHSVLEPCGLQALASRQARNLRSNDYGYDLERIVSEIAEIVPRRPVRNAQPATAKTGGLVRHGSVPVVPPYYAARDREMSALERALAPNTWPVAPVAIVGIGGVGKTLIAASYFRSQETANRYGVMAWIDARLDIDHQLVELAQALRLPRRASTAETLTSLFAWLRVAQAPWLLVLDNATDPTGLEALLGIGGHGHVVLTSKYRYWDDYAHVMAIEPLPATDAASLLRRVARRPSDPDAERLGEYLGGLPLALGLAGTRCRENAHSFRAYLAQLQRDGGPSGHRADQEIARRLDAVLSDSLSLACGRAPSADVALRLMSYLDWRSVDRAWLTGGLAGTELADELDAVLSALNAYQLATLTEDSVAITHGIIASSARDRLDPTNGTACDDLLVVLLGSALPAKPSADLRSVRLAANTLHHAVVFMSTMGRPCPENLVEVLFRVCNQLREQRDHDRYLALARGILCNVESRRAPDDMQMLMALSHVAIALWLGGRNEEALPRFERVARDRSRILGADHPESLLARANLAVSYREANRVDEAVVVMEEVVADRRRVQEADHPRLMTARGQLGVIYRAAGRGADALTVFTELATDRQRVLGADHPDTISARYEMALAYRQVGNHAKALVILQHVAQDRERVLGPDHPHVFSARHELALCWLQTGRTADAFALLKGVVADRTRVLGPDHADTRTARQSLEAAGG